MPMTVEPPRPLAEFVPDNARGITAMLAAMAFFCVGDTLVKIVGRDLPIGEIMFVRGLIATALIILLAGYQGVISQWRSVITPVNLIRAACDVGATITFFTGLMQLPFADCAAIAQFMPLAVTALAAILLNEPVGWRRWLAALVGLIGVLIIIRPGTSAFNWAALWIVFTVVFVAFRDVLTRRIATSVSPVLITALSTIVITTVGLAMAPAERWVTPAPHHVAALSGAAVMILGGLTSIVIAMRSGEVAVISPFRYAVIVFAVASGYFVFGEVPDLWTFVGIAIVVAAGVYTFHREAVRRREQRERVAKASATRSTADYSGAPR